VIGIEMWKSIGDPYQVDFAQAFRIASPSSFTLPASHSRCLWSFAFSSLLALSCISLSFFLAHFHFSFGSGHFCFCDFVSIAFEISVSSFGVSLIDLSRILDQVLLLLSEIGWLIQARSKGSSKLIIT
jgi:hypothetical protein